MNALQLANVLQFSVVAAFWAIVLFKMIPAMRLDSFRQQMFSIRDDLFDFAADGHIAFNDPAYVLLRKQMNGFIRYAHHLTVFRILMTAAIQKLSGRPAPNEWSPDWERARAAIKSEYVRERLDEIHRRAVNLAVKRLLIGSPVLWSITSIFLVQLLFEGAAKSVSQLIRMAARKALTGPINDRSIEEIAQGVAA